MLTVGLEIPDSAQAEICEGVLISALYIYKADAYWQKKGFIVAVSKTNKL